MKCLTPGKLLLLSLSLALAVVKAHWPHDVVDAIAVYKDGEELFAALRLALLLSRDSGKSWRYVRPLNSYDSYLALSPYDKTLYVLDGSELSRSTNLIEWEELDSVDACNFQYFRKTKRRMTFPASGALIAGWGQLYKENTAAGEFEMISDGNFTNCPSLSAVPDSDVVYAGGVDGLMRSDDGGWSWNLVVSMTDIIEVLAKDEQVFVITATGVYQLRYDEELDTVDPIDVEEQPMLEGDNVVAATPNVIVDIDFTTEDFVYMDDAFRNTNNGLYAQGWWMASSPSLVTTRLGGRDDSVVENMSGGFKIQPYTLESDAVDVVVDMRYKVLFESDFEEGEDTEVLLSVGDELFVVDVFLGADSPTTTAWKTASISIGPQSAGVSYEVIFGGFLSSKSESIERAKIQFDEISVTASILGGAAKPTIEAKETAAMIDLMMPETQSLEWTREGQSSVPLDLTYIDGTLIVARANSYSVYMLSGGPDFVDATWDYRNWNEGDFPTTGHIGKNGWDFNEDEEFTHLEDNYLASWTGVYKTSDAGKSWLYRDTIRNAITVFGITKSSITGDFTVWACTYSSSCYQGAENELIPDPVGPGFYESLHLSPNYAVDGIGFKNDKKILTWVNGTQIDVPVLEEGVQLSIKGVVFPPNFRLTGTVYIYGYNIGIVASHDFGRTFSEMLFPGHDGQLGLEVTRLVVSPNFAVDGTMACLVQPDFNGKTRRLVDQYIYGTQDFGQTWRRVIWAGEPWRDIIIVNGDTDIVPVIVALDDKGVIWARTADLANPSSFERIESTTFNPRPLGYGQDGLGVSPDGSTIALAFAEGGFMIGSVKNIGGTYTFTDRSMSQPNIWTTDLDDPFAVYTRNPPVFDSYQRVLTSHISFSPDYETDETIYAADMFAVYKSTNKGRTFEQTFQFENPS